MADEVEPEFALVYASEAENAERLELPTNLEDASLNVQTLTRAFPGAHGLKYKNPNTGAYRALSTDTTGTFFCKPAGGWQNKLFIVISHQPQIDAFTTPRIIKDVCSNINNSANANLNSEPTEVKTEKSTNAVVITTTAIDTTNTAAVTTSVASGSAVGSQQPPLSTKTWTSVAKKTHAKMDQNAKRRRLMVVDSDEDDNALSSGSENNEKRSLRQSAASGTVKSVKQKRFNSSESDDALPQCSELIILGLSFKVTEDEVKEYFEEYGGLAFLEIKRKFSGTSKGFAFLRMATFDGQMRVLKKANHVIGNRKCQVRVPTGKNGEEREDPTAGTKVYVGRLQERTSVSELRKYFEEEVRRMDENASVVDVYIPKPFRAFAFVTFSNPIVTKKIIKKNNYIIDGAQLSLQLAQPKNSSSQTSLGGARSPATNQMYTRGNSAAPPFDDNASLYGGYGFESNWYESQPFRNDLFSSRSNAVSHSPFNRIPSTVFGNNYANMTQSTSGNLAAHNAAFGHHGSQILASGLETLNLNNMKPELITALQALMYTQQSSKPHAVSSALKGSGGRAEVRSPIPLAAAVANNNNGSGEKCMSSSNKARNASPPVFPLLGPQRLYGGPHSGGNVGSAVRGGKNTGGLSSCDYPPGFDAHHHHHYSSSRRSGGSSRGGRNGGDGWR